MRLSRRIFCSACFASAGMKARAAEPPPDATYADDFDEMWRTLADRYCYFREKTTDWAKVRSLSLPQAVAAQSDEAFAEIVRRVLNELYDPHTHLSAPPDGSPHWPLFDLLVERDHGTVRIAAIQPGSSAAAAGLRIGDVVQHVDGVPIEDAVRRVMPLCLARPDPEADRYALNVAVAGRKGFGRTLVVARGGGMAGRDVRLALLDAPRAADLDYRVLPRGFGVIVIRSFGENAITAQFDAALAALRDTPALIIDVRDNGGGDTAIARPIMGRFITQRLAYARMRRREASGLSTAWTEYVDPRGPFTYTNPVAVLTSPWSASMAEGFPMSMRDIGRARVVAPA